MRKGSIEIIVESVRDAINAQKGGADRLELVAALSEGGLTPSLAMVEAVIKNMNVEVAVMLRPTSKTFTYDRDCLDIMKRDAEIFQEIGVKRLVVGILDKKGRVDIEALDYVLENIDIGVTFHRAIDESKDILEDVKRLNECKKVSHILTSGGVGLAQEHLEILNEIIELSEKRIILASGLNLSVLERLKTTVRGVYDVHFGRFAQDKDGFVDAKKVELIRDLF